MSKENAYGSYRMILLLSIVTKIVVFTKNIILASILGTGYSMDSFVMSSSLILMISEVLINSVSTIIIPILLEIISNDWEQIQNSFFNWRCF